jgi:hypothetical protein
VPALDSTIHAGRQAAATRRGAGLYVPWLPENSWIFLLSRFGAGMLLKM